MAEDETALAELEQLGVMTTAVTLIDDEVAVGLRRIVESILRDQHTVLAVSSLVPGYYSIEGLYLSLPAVIGRGGVERVLNLPLNEQETEALRKSAAVLRGVLDELER